MRTSKTPSRLLLTIALFIGNRLLQVSCFAPSTGRFHRSALHVASADSEKVRSSEELSDGSSSGRRKQQLKALDDALRSFNASATNSLLTEISELRLSSEPDQVGRFLDDLLDVGPDSSLPFWSRFRKLARVSKRARLYSLRRLLDLATPPPSENETENSPLSNQQRRRQRALVSVLRSLATSSEENELDGSITTKVLLPAIVVLEKKARDASKTRKGAKDLKSRLPEDLETPSYNVLDERMVRNAKFEIRSYEAFATCTVSMTKPRPENSNVTDAKVSLPELSGASSFGALAGYLFGKNDKSMAMKMTTPVISNGEGTDRQMAFVLPSEFWKDEDFGDAPKPLEGSGVSLQRDQGGERAVLMFGGYASRREVEQRSKQLLDCISKQDGWKAKDESVATAQYNDPFTPPWKRLNEVSVSISANK